MKLYKAAFERDEEIPLWTWTNTSTVNHIPPSKRNLWKQYRIVQSVSFTTELMTDSENRPLADVDALMSIGLISYSIIQSPIPWLKYMVYLHSLLELSWNINKIVKYDTHYDSCWSRSHIFKENLWCSGMQWKAHFYLW